jgi:hypothetical protein
MKLRTVIIALVSFVLAATARVNLAQETGHAESRLVRERTRLLYAASARHKVKHLSFSSIGVAWDTTDDEIERIKSDFPKAKVYRWIDDVQILLLP